MAGEEMLSVDFTGGDDDGGGEEIVVAFEDSGEAKILKPPVPGQQVTKKVETEDPVDDLKNQFATLTNRAQMLQQEVEVERQRADEAARRAHAAEGGAISGQLDTVVSGIQASEQALKAAKANLVAAHEAGNLVEVADIQADIGMITARISRLQEAKADIEDAIKARPKEPQQPQRRQQQPSDPVEAFIQRNNIPGKSAEFIRKNPSMATDPKVYKRALAAHNLAEADDIAIESDEYFDRISEAIGVKKVEPQQQQQKPAPERRPSAPAAPAGGGGTGGAQLQGGTEVRLTPGEARSATDGTLVWNYDDPSPEKKFKKGEPIGLAEMARRKHYGQKAGLYDKNAMEA